jgi:translocator protein
MKVKIHYVIIPLITIVVAALSSYFVHNGIDWYENDIYLPGATPPRWIYPVFWNIIFVCTTVSAIILWNKKPSKAIIGLFSANLIFNLSWTFIFFNLHWIKFAFADMLLLELSLFGLMALSWNTSKEASILLMPYAVWVAYATYVTYLIILGA